MKTLFKILSIGLFVSFAYSCNSDDPDVIINNLKEGQIEIKVFPGVPRNEVSFSVTAANITIDWGDGSVEEFTLNGTTEVLTHSYTNRELQTIIVDTKSMTEFGLGLYGSYKELRFGNNPTLEYLDCYNNGLTILSIEKASALTYLSCGYNQLKSLDVSGCVALKILYCEYNQLKTLNINGCTALTVLGCYKNQLSSLDMSKCTELMVLSCSYNELMALDVSKCTGLLSLGCSDNKLTLLDVTKCVELNGFSCDYNRLTTLDVSKCINLTDLSCRGNQLTATDLNSLFNSLPNKYDVFQYFSIYIANNPGTDTCDKSIAIAKGWDFYE